MLDPSHLSLGADLAREQDLLLGDKRLTQDDLIRGVGRAKLRIVERHRRIAIWLLALVILTVTVVATVASKFPIIQYSVQGQQVASTERVFGHWVVAPGNEPKTIRFTDGSQAGLVPGSRVRLIGTNRRGATLNLESGSLELVLAGSRLTEYLVSVGPFSLTLAKGRMMISWDPVNELLDLVVHEGYVVISGCQFETGRSVTTGRELSTRCLGRQSGFQ